MGTIQKLFDPYGTDKTDDWSESSATIPISKAEDDPDLIAAKRAIVCCRWFCVYDIIVDVFEQLCFYEQRQNDPEEEFCSFPLQRDINDYFVHEGIGWQLVNGEIITRGNDAFEHTIEVAGQELAERPTTRARIQEAINNLSRRPKPDLSGAVSHAFAAMECIIGDIEYTPEEISQNKHHTFGAFLQRHPNLFPSDDLKDGFKHLWKYANNEGGRHGKEGMEPARDEAELIVSLAATLVTYLNRKHPK